MVIIELKKYIKEAITAGLNEEEIIVNLLNAGWDSEDVDIAIKDFLSKEKVHKIKKVKHLKSKVVYSYLLIIFGILLILLTLYMSRSLLSGVGNYFINNGNTASVSNIIHFQKRTLKKKESTLLFVGDIMLSENRGTGKQIEQHKDVRYPFLKIADTLRSADLTFGNLEGPISSHGKDMGSKYSFRDTPDVVGGLKFAGFDVMSVANNHIFDWGRSAFDDTLSILKSNGIDPVGGGRNYTKANIPVIKNINGVKIAFLAYNLIGYNKKSSTASGDTSGESYFNLKNTETEIKRIKELNIADIVVVSFHWGEEYKTKSDIKQQNIAHSLINAGADIIIGHHPHVVEEIEQYKNKWIVYSLGNFVFDQSFSKNTMNGFIVEVKINNKTKKISSVIPIKIKISKTFQPEIS